MADIRLVRPEAGTNQAVACEPEAKFVFDFPTDAATLSRNGDNLVMTFEDGATLTLTDFYKAYSSKNMPSFEVDGAQVAGADFFAAMNEPDLMPAAGPGGRGAAGVGGGRFHQYADMALNYLRLDEGGSDLVIRPCALDGVIRQCVHKFAPQFVQKRLYLRYDGCDVTVLTDEKWLAFIIGQLLSNAVKYTDTGGVTVTVEPGPVLRIADTGIGIAAEDLPRIFEKGFTGYNGRTDRTATGLGLYLCRRAADMLHHRLWAQSEPGAGSVFCLDLHRDELGVE